MRFALGISTRMMEFNEETLALYVAIKHALTANFLGTGHTPDRALAAQSRRG